MDRLTFLDNGSPAYKLNGCVYKNEIARKLYAYEDTGLAPEDIIALIRRIDDIYERVVRGGTDE